MPILAIPSVPKPSVDGVGPSHVPTVRPFTGKNACLELGEPSIGLAQLSDDSVECVAFVPPCPKTPRAPSWKEMVELLKQVPCFTESEGLVNNIGDLFSTTRRVSMDLSGDPNISFVARLPFNTLDSIASHILPM
ncbi:hypothetical protein CK203_108206 [Vitis vinifera]|uniref:Uncharacterized protein n=1 Tax=Vitis vinifera TaxID=29760 RepID=A0A438CPW9_VITVI|nr:hypothetical protein CK203_108206 [Vitis vinifera]